MRKTKNRFPLLLCGEFGLIGKLGKDSSKFFVINWKKSFSVFLKDSFQSGIENASSTFSMQTHLKWRDVELARRKKTWGGYVFLLKRTTKWAQE